VKIVIKKCFNIFYIDLYLPIFSFILEDFSFCTSKEKKTEKYKSMFGILQTTPTSS